VIVGDWVAVEPTGPLSGVIETICPRRSRFSREASGSRPYEQIIAVNLDQLVVVVSIREPSLRVGFIDRAVVMALRGKMQPVVCINKIDLGLEDEYFAIGKMYRDLGYGVYFTSARTGDGVEAFKAGLKGRVSAVVGQSGVGKSSLLNRIEPGLSIKTQKLMKQHDRGRHTTAAVQLYRLREGGYVADTPGIKELRLWGVNRLKLIEFFAEMGPLASGCRFRNCTHLREPGCSVREAVELGEISPLRYEGYSRIMATLE
jgi:ribosome biogenesis GTPase